MNDSHYNSEHYYNEQGFNPLGYAQSEVPSHKSSEHYYNEQGFNPLGYAPSEVPSHKSSEHYYNEEGKTPVQYKPSMEPSYYNSEHYYGDGIIYGIGPNINGKTVKELIQSGLLTKDSIKEEDKQIVFDDILIGLTRTTNLLAQKLDLIIDNKYLINKLVSEQYKLAIRYGSNDQDVSYRDRNFQFLATIKILIEKGYNIQALSFKNEIGESITLDKLLSNFRRKCFGKMQDPSWFKDGNKPENFDDRIVNEPYLFAGSLLRDMHKKYINKYYSEYDEYKKSRNVTLEQIQTYSQFIRNVYGIEVPDITIERFKEERNIQLSKDQALREINFGELTDDLKLSNKGKKV